MHEVRHRDGDAWPLREVLRAQAFVSRFASATHREWRDTPGDRVNRFVTFSTNVLSNLYSPHRSGASRAISRQFPTRALQKSAPDRRSRPRPITAHRPTARAIEVFMGSDCAGVHGLSVLERYQRRGIGSALLEHVWDDVRAHGVRKHRSARHELRGTRLMCVVDSRSGALRLLVSKLSAIR